MTIELRLGYRFGRQREAYCALTEGPGENSPFAEYNLSSLSGNFWRRRKVRRFLERYNGQRVELQAPTLAKSFDPRLHELKGLVDSHNQRIAS